jgi:hypothetical protein
MAINRGHGTAIDVPLHPDENSSNIVENQRPGALLLARVKLF